MKEVYIIYSSYDYEGGQIEIVFDSLKKAQEHQNKLMEKFKEDYYNKDEEIEKWSSDENHWSMKLGDYCIVIIKEVIK